MAILFALTNILFPLIVLLIIIAITALVLSTRYGTICEYTFIVSAVSIAVIAIFNIIVGLIINITNFCTLI